MSARTSKPKPAPLSWSKPEAAVPPEEKADRKTIDAAAIALKPVASDLPASVPAGTDRPVDAPEAVETLNLAIIRPDPLQGRRALPHDIRLAYQSGTLTAEEAAREWLKRADGGDEKERVKIQAYLDLADSLGERQINPISVIALPRGGPYRFVIESGERRFWAMWLRVVRGQQIEKTIQAIVRPTFSTWRQIGENAQQEDMTAIELALTVARAWLAQLDIVADPVGARRQAGVFLQAQVEGDKVKG